MTDQNVKFYLAPMEGISGYNFRNAVNKYFGENVDKYFSPFVSPHVKRPMTNRELEDINPANNAGMKMIPQIMTNDNEGFDRLLEVIYAMGYDEVNINLGCPSKTVTSRGRGSGFLKYPEALDEFLYTAYEHNPGLKLSLKTRIGYDVTDSWDELLQIYAKYPITELIVHPRFGVEQYNGTPHMDEFMKTFDAVKCPVIYNGDIYTSEDFEKLLCECKEHAGRIPDGVMLGRGVVRNPAIIRELAGGAVITTEERERYLNFLLKRYKEVLFDDTTVLHKMKEMWVYMQRDFPGKEKLCKKLFKCRHIDEFVELQDKILN